MLSTYDVLQQISQYWDDMTNAEKSNLAITLAKKTQMDTFLAVMGNFGDAEKAYVTSLKSEGSALEENAEYMKSIEAHQKALKEQWEKLVLSAPFEDLEKALLSTATALLKFANSDVGQTIIKITALITVMLTLNTAMTAFQKLLATNTTSAFLSTIAQLIAGEITLTQVTVGLTTAMLANPLFWGAAIIAGTVLLIQHIKKLSHAYEEHVQELREVTAEYKNQQEETKTLAKDLEDIRKKIEEIEKQKLEITDKDELSKLEAQSNELSEQETKLKNQLILEEAKTKELEKQAKLKLQDTMNEKSDVTTYDFNKQTSGYISGNEVDYARTITTTTPLEGLKEQLLSYENLKNKLAEVKEEAKSFGSTQTAAIEENLKLQKELEDAMSDLETEMTDNLDVAKQAVELNNEQKDSAQNLINQYDKLINTEDDAQSNLDAIRNSVENLTESEEEASNAWDGFLDNIEDIQSAYETLNKAMDEYNQNGFITASTLKKLNKLQPEYIAQLEIVNGKMQIGNGLLQEEFEKEKQLAIDAVLVAKQLRVQAVCQEYLNDKTNEATKAAETASPKINELATSFNTLANESRKAGTAVQYAYAAIANDEVKKDALKARLDDIDAWADGMIDSINAVNLGATKSSKSSASSTKDAWKEAFEEEQRLLKHSLEMNEITEIEYYEKLKDLNEKYFGEISGKHKKYVKEYQENEEEIYKGTKAIYDKVKDYLKEAVEQGYEKAINALKKEEKAVLAEIKSQIENLKKEKKSVLDGIKDQINALKKQKEQVQKYYNDQIDAIKKENEVLQEQNQLLEYQQQLQQAKAQKVMVMQDGKFQLGENESAVAQAEQNLNNYKDQLSYEQQIKQLEELRDAQVEAIEARIQSLEEYYDYMEDYYDRQIEAMEDYYDRVQEQYEKQIEALQEELDTFKEGYKKAEDLDNARLAAEVMAANEEASVWRARLDNLAEAISEYNRLLSLMGEEGVYATSGFSGGTVSHNAIAEISGANTALEGFKSRASGDASFASNEIALVGESPNTELVLGSKLNHSLGGGELVHLSKGSGVVNAESTRTLAGLLNGLANPQSVSTNHTTQQTFTFGSISLPNVTNAETFVGALRDKFNNYSIQSTTIKK